MRVITVLALVALVASPAAAQFQGKSTVGGLGTAGAVPGSGASQHMKDVLHNRETSTADKYNRVGAYAKRKGTQTAPTPQAPP